MAVSPRRTEAAGQGALERLSAFLPAIAFLGTFGVFFVDKNREARTVLSSGRGLIAMIAIIGGYLVIGFVVRRVVRWAWVPPLVLTVVTLSLAAWIVRPYYVDETANRVLATGPVRDASEATAPPMSDAQPAPGVSSTPTAPTPQAPPPSGPVRVSRGSLQGVGHDARGTASIIRNASGSLVVRFEAFDIEGVPDPRVYVVQGNDVEEAGGTYLGRLTGNRGQVLDYEVPAGTSAGPGWTVLVWCEAFSVPVANASQTAA
jgi:hypothetical protein